MVGKAGTLLENSIRGLIVAGLVLSLAEMALAQSPISGTPRTPVLVPAPARAGSVKNTAEREGVVISGNGLVIPPELSAHERGLAEKKWQLHVKQEQLRSLQREVAALTMEIAGQQTVNITARCLEVEDWPAFCVSQKMKMVPGAELAPASQKIDAHTFRGLEQLLVQGLARQLGDQRLTLLSGSTGMLHAGSPLLAGCEPAELKRRLQTRQKSSVKTGSSVEVGSGLRIAPEIASSGQLRIACESNVTRVHFDKPITQRDGSVLPAIERTGVRFGSSLDLKSGETLLVCSGAARAGTPQVIWLVKCEIESGSPVRAAGAVPTLKPVSFEQSAP
jgi:hypothetical protein